MSVDIATLGLEVRSDGVQTATNRLREMQQEARSTEDASGKLLTATDKSSASFGNLAGYVKAAAAAFAAWKLTQYIQESTLLAARVETLGVVMRIVGNNVGYTANQMDLYAKGIAKMGITTEASREAATKMAQAHVNMAKSSDLARIAQDAAVIANLNSSEAFERMTIGIATQQGVILHHMGLMVNWEAGYEELAATLGKTTKELTENEKVAARVNEVIKAGSGIAGSYEAAMGTAGKQLNSMKRYFDEIKLSVGDPFTPAFTELLAGVTVALKATSGALHDNKAALAAVANELVNPMGLFTDFKAILEMNKQAGEALTSTLPGLEGTLAVIAAAAYSAIGGIAGLTVAFDGLIASIAASQAANPAAWAVAVGAATYLAAKSAVTSLDSLGHAYLGVNLTGEAYYKEEQARLKQAEKNWDDFKKKAVWMYKEGGIQTPVAMQDPEVKRIAEGEKKRKEEDERQRKEAAEKAAEEARELAEKQAQYDKQLLESRTAVSEQERRLSKEKEDAILADKIAALERAKAAGLKTTAEYLNEKYDLERASMQKELDAANAHATKVYQNYQKINASPATDEIMQNKAWEEYLKAMEAAYKIKQKMDASTNQKLGDNDQLKRDQDHFEAEQRIQNLQIRGNKLGAEAAANELKYADMRKKNYTEDHINLVRINDQLKIAWDLYERRVAVQRELNALDAENAQKAASMVGIDPSTGVVDTIQGQIDQQMAIQQAAHDRRMQMIEEEEQAAMDAWSRSSQSAEDYKEVIGKLGAASTKRSLEEQDNTNRTTEIHKKGEQSKLSALSQYTGMAGQLISGLADLQDTSSRKGFETAKAMNIASAVVNTAAGIMNAFATSGNIYTGIAMAAMVAATGAMQIAKIQSTTFGGGGSVAAPSGGSFGGGGGGPSASVGIKIGAPIRYGSDATDSGQMEALAASAHSASLAVGDLTSAFKAATKAFSEGGIGSSMLDRLWGMSNGSIKTAGNPLQDPQFIAGMNALTKANLALIDKAATALGTSVGTPGATTITPGWHWGEFTKENLSEGMNAVMADIVNAYAKGVKGLEEFAKPGEDASVALQRLSSALYTTDKQFDKLGITLLKGLAGANIASKFEEAFAAKGDDFHKAVDNYFKAAFTDEQQKAMEAARATNEVQAAFNQMNLLMPTTKAGLVSLVNSLDLTTAQGQSTFATIMSISEAFGIMTDQAEKAKKAQLDLSADIAERTAKLDKSDAADLFSLLQKHQEELTDAQKENLDTTALVALQTREYSAALTKLVESYQKAESDFLNDIQLRGLRAGGKNNAATLLALLIQQEKELADARAKGYDVTALVAVQQKEYDNQLAEMQKSALNEMTQAQVAFNQIVVTARKNVADAQTAYDQAVAAAQKQAQTKVINDQLSGAQKVADAWKSAVESIEDTIKSMTQEVLNPAQQAQVAKVAFDLAKGKALKGDADAAGNLSQLGTDYLTASKATAATRTQYLLEVGRVMGSLTQVNALGKTRLSTAEQQIKLLQAQLDTLNATEDHSVGDAATALETAKQQLAVLEALGLETKDSAKADWEIAAENLTTAKAAYQEAMNLRGTVSEQLAIHIANGNQAHEDALAQVNAINTMAQSMQAAQVALGTHIDDLASQLAMDAAIKAAAAAAKAAADAAAKAAADAAAKAAADAAAAAKPVSPKPAAPQDPDRYTPADNYGKNPDRAYASGTAYVDGDQIAKIHNGEKIIDAQSSSILSRYGIRIQGGGAPDNAELLQLVEHLLEEMANLRAENKAGQIALAKNSSELTRLMKRWDGDGMPATRAA